MRCGIEDKLLVEEYGEIKRREVERWLPEQLNGAFEALHYNPPSHQGRHRHYSEPFCLPCSTNFMRLIASLCARASNVSSRTPKVDPKTRQTHTAAADCLLEMNPSLKGSTVVSQCSRSYTRTKSIPQTLNCQPNPKSTPKSCVTSRGASVL
jgi:hypothetical protein